MRVFRRPSGGAALFASRKRRATLAIAAVGCAAFLIGGYSLAAADSDGVAYSGRTLHSPADAPAFDISWVEQSTGRYFLADRGAANTTPGGSVDWFSLASDVNGDAFAAFLGKGQFAGSPPTCGKPRGCGGPNGVVTDKQHRVWAGDGPQGGVNSIKMIDLPNGQSVAKTINLGGQFRADELAYDSEDQVIEIASDFDGFLSFVSTVPGSEHVIKTFYYADNLEGQHPTVEGLSTAGGGIEQPVWDGKTRLFYQAIPGNPTDGRVDVFTASGTYVKSFSAPGCDGGPTGLTLTRNEQLIGACANAGIALDVHNGHVRALIPGVGGADEVWFNPGDGNVYFAMSGPPGLLGVANADNDKFVTTLPTQAAGGAHSVAAYAGATNQILVPLTGNGIKVFVSSGRGNDRGNH